MAKIKEKIVYDLGVVLYADGGCRPTNPGNTGWGVHGYLYEDYTPKKGTGNKTHMVTASGYVPKEARETGGFKEVNPIKMFDFFGSTGEIASNNVAELDAIRHGLSRVLEIPDIKVINVYTDSQYVRKGVEEWRFAWVKRNWIRMDGTPVPNAVKWKELIKVLDEIQSRKIVLNVSWVKGHNDIYGNTMADKLATIAVLYAMKNKHRTEYDISEPEGYWNSEIERHPFVCSKRMIFNTLSSSHIPGEYYLCDNIKDEDYLACKNSDSSYSVIQISPVEEILEIIRTQQTLIAEQSNTLVNTRLDKLYSRDVYYDILEHQDCAMIRPKSYNFSLSCLDDKPLTQELVPPYLAMRAIGYFELLKALLLRFKDEERSIPLSDAADTSFKSHDITDIFYEPSVIIKKKVEETVCLLKPKYVSGYSSEKLKADVDINGELKEIDVILTFGNDIPDRNFLKRMEVLNPKVFLITWKEGLSCIRFATIIKAQDNYGIWVNIHANTHYIK